MTEGGLLNVRLCIQKSSRRGLHVQKDIKLHVQASRHGEPESKSSRTIVDMVVPVLPTAEDYGTQMIKEWQKDGGRGALNVRYLADADAVDRSAP